MDPVTGIGLAASVVQIVQFGINAAKTCQQIYQQGSTSEQSDADFTADRLANLTSSLQHSLQKSATSGFVLSKEEKDLVDLGKKCEDCAHKLQHELRKLRARSQASTMEAARKTARSVWKKGSIVKIQEQLESYRRMLETSLLYDLSERFDTGSLRSSERFTELDQALKGIITCLADSQTSLTTLLQQESEQTRQHVAARLDRAEQLYKDEQFSQDIKKSLFFPDICSRQEQIAYEFDGIEDSYEWIFAEGSETDIRSDNAFEDSPQKLRWSNFSEWLRSGDSVYWINGKAGSGKSTLMNYICDHKKTRKYLKQWSANRRLLTPTFFFWNAGARQQKSIDGLLRSLIYQMLSDCPELVSCLKHEPLYAWTEKRLLSTLSALLTQKKMTIAICLFIDGLDEFEGRYIAVVETMNNLSNQAHVKICLSSRPLLDFERAFDGRPTLKLQDLTHSSIRTYAATQLFGSIEQQIGYSKDDKRRARDLVEQLVVQAKGVFLWAVIAIRDLRDGLQDIVDLSELAREIESLPAGVENLYMQMLSRIKPAYRRDAARFLQIVLYVSEIYSGMRSLDLYRLYFIDREHVVEDLPLIYSEAHRSNVIKACQNLKTRLLSHTLGLLELTPNEEIEDIYCGINHCEQILRTKVQIFHKTVKDFLVHNDAAKTFLKAAGSVEVHIRLSIARGTLSHLKDISPQDGDIANRDCNPAQYNALRSAFMQISLAESLVGAAQTKLMQSLDVYSFAAKGLFMGAVYHCKFPRSSLPYLIGSLRDASIDMVGMAAECSMGRYICEILGLPFLELSENHTNFSSCPHFYSKDEALVAELSWVAPSNCKIDYSSYHSQLRQLLKRETHSRATNQTNKPVDCFKLAETYLLACCRPSLAYRNCFSHPLTLIGCLINAGANPMVRVKSAGGTIAGTNKDDTPDCFWARWLHFVRWHYYRHSAEGAEQPIVTLDLVFSYTKALLAKGAQINYQMKPDSSIASRSSIKRNDFVFTELDLEITSSAMFWLEEGLSGHPDFHEFATALNSQVKRPLRKIVSITPNHLDLGIVDESGKPLAPARAAPNEEESKMLWTLIEKWEETGDISDLDALKSAMRRIWRAHRPDIELREESGEE